MVETDKRSDGELLAAVVSREAQDCFTELVRRHGSMVLGVCRRQLGDKHDAEDAAQAAFLVLWQKGRTLRRRSSVAGWLHHVARNICRNAKRAKDVRRKHEREAATKPNVSCNQHQHSEEWDRIKDLLDGELDALPGKYRTPIVLFHLEGRSLEETALLSRLKTSTLTTRLHRGREMLRQRLARRGITISTAALASLLMTHVTTAALPLFFAETTTKAANLYALGQTTAGGLVSARTVALTKGALDMFTVIKIRTIVSVLIATLLIVGASSFLIWQTMESPTQARTQFTNEPGADKKSEPIGGVPVDGLRLALSAEKSETVMKADGSNAEPVELKLTFTNVSDKPIKLDTYVLEYRRLEFQAIGFDPEDIHIEITEFDLEIAPPTAKDFPVIQPGQSWSPNRTTSFPGGIPQKIDRAVHYFIRKPGTYKLRYTYDNQKPSTSPLAKGSWTGRVKSNEFVLRVRPHKPRDKKNSPNKGLSFEVKPKQREFAAGESLEFVFTYKNTSQETLVGSLDWNAHDITVTDTTTGTVWEFIYGYPAIPPRPPAGSTDKRSDVELPSGKTRIEFPSYGRQLFPRYVWRRVKKSGCFNHLPPGKYRADFQHKVEASRDFPVKSSKPWRYLKETITSNPVEFTIVSKKTEARDPELKLSLQVAPQVWEMGGEIKLLCTFHNNSSEPIRIPRWGLMDFSPILELRDVWGKVVYVDTKRLRTKELPSNAFPVIPPGKSEHFQLTAKLNENRQLVGPELQGGWWHWHNLVDGKCSVRAVIDTTHSNEVLSRYKKIRNVKLWQGKILSDPIFVEIKKTPLITMYRWPGYGPRTTKTFLDLVVFMDGHFRYKATTGQLTYKEINGLRQQIAKADVGPGAEDAETLKFRWWDDHGKRREKIFTNPRAPDRQRVLKLLEDLTSNRPKNKQKNNGEVPNLLRPKPGAELDNGRIDTDDSKVVWEFRWTAIKDANRYQLQVFSAQAEKPTIDKITKETTYRHVQAGTYADRYGWKWRVRAIRDAQPLSWSDFRIFDVKAIKISDN